MIVMQLNFGCAKALQWKFCSWDLAVIDDLFFGFDVH